MKQMAGVILVVVLASLSQAKADDVATRLDELTRQVQQL